eukprot:gb/GECG01001454.1/.p1 GENE.gb/GECG01001454.1/~~gb/GECG01001454.1/.p1  ORF type:complete len:594 (+),score=68.91 gb/GECG01001454.1/:1-1782(+)
MKLLNPRPGLWLLMAVGACMGCGASIVGARDFADYVSKHTCHHFDAERACTGSELLYGHVFNGIEEVDPDSGIGHRLQQAVVDDVKQRTPKQLTAHAGLACCRIAGCESEGDRNCSWEAISVNVDSIKLVDLNYVVDETQREILANFSHSRSFNMGVSFFSTSRSQWLAKAGTSSGSIQLKHHTGHTIDAKAAVHLLEFRFHFLSQGNSSSESAEVDAEGEVEHRGESSYSKQDIRIVNYNIWNSNPPQWLFKTRRARWNRYIQRMNLFKKTVKDVRPDVLLLQEVRMDETLDKSKGRYNQMEHLATLFPSYQFVFQPANLYPHAVENHERDEEGVGVMSRFPIVDSDYLLLSQNYDDAEDEHRRVVLHAVLKIPGVATSSYDKCTSGKLYNSTHCAALMDVFTTHFPLSKDARQRHTQEVLNYMANSKRGELQILGGDLNAEPHEDEIKMLNGLLERKASGRARPKLLDSWLCHHEEPSTEENASTEERRHSLTFASDNATKRIDYLFVDAASVDDFDHVCPQYPFRLEQGFDTAEIFKSMKLRHLHPPFLIGQDYMEGSGDPEKSDGMVDKNSPLYASDHRGLVLDISIET